MGESQRDIGRESEKGGVKGREREILGGKERYWEREREREKGGGKGSEGGRERAEREILGGRERYWEVERDIGR